jgi:hypothetical protein
MLWRGRGGEGERGRSRFFTLSPPHPLAPSLLFALLAMAAAPSPEAVKVVEVSPELRVSIAEGEEVFLSARPLPNESVEAFIQRLTQDPKAKKDILAQNQELQLRRHEICGARPLPSARTTIGRSRSKLFSRKTGRIRADGLMSSRLRPATPRALAHRGMVHGEGTKPRKFGRRAASRRSRRKSDRWCVFRSASPLPAFRLEATAEKEPRLWEFGKDEKGRFAIIV